METIKLNGKTFKCSKELKEEIEYLNIKIEVTTKLNKQLVETLMQADALAISTPSYNKTK